MTTVPAPVPPPSLSGTDTTGGAFQLRAWRPDDVPSMTAAVVASLEHLRPWMPWAQNGYATTDAEEFIARSVSAREAGETFNYGIFRPDGAAVLGAAGLMGRIGPGALEIGYWVHVDAVRQGLATGASRLLTGAAFALGVERVEIHHDRANVASGAVPARLGYTLDRSEPREFTTPGECGITQIWVTAQPG